METQVRLGVSSIVSAFESKTVGSKVLFPEAFDLRVQRAISQFDWSTCREPGQAFISLEGDDLNTLVSTGVGRRSSNPEDYVVRPHRGRVDLFLRREFASPLESLAVIVYTTEAYAADPQVSDEEAEIQKHNSHVLVAVLASAGPRPPLGPYRLVANLAGGNNEAAQWDADEIRSLASDSIAYDDEWVVVAD